MVCTQSSISRRTYEIISSEEGVHDVRMTSKAAVVVSGGGVISLSSMVSCLLSLGVRRAVRVRREILRRHRDGLGDGVREGVLRPVLLRALEASVRLRVIAVARLARERAERSVALHRRALEALRETHGDL